ncbi:MAG: hypothetical protein ACYSYM_02080 [Planctomycetota bacterium]|jgi:hypothetical protein
MNNSTPDFSLKVDGVEGNCPAGEKYALENIAAGKIPVLSCEGPCIRGEIARLAANIVAKEDPYALLKCLGRVLRNFIDEERIIHIDILPLHKKYGDAFLYTDVPEAERTEVAQEVADKILTMLKEERVLAE